MCGITGKLSWGEPPRRDVLERMNAQLVHRGPDAEGIHLAGPLGFAHRRLSVIDLHEHGNQPLFDHSRNYVIVYNGEIYNFMSLRAELEESGAQFQTNTDTEVIVEAYKAWGTACLQRFIGMFSFALWDEREQLLFLARDRLGQKPLFYYPHADGGITFASELKALLEDPDIERTFNPNALQHYLSLNYSLTSESFVRGVCKLEPAHYAIVQRGKTIEVKEYWNLAEHFCNKQTYRSESEAEEALSALLQESVDLRLISDVPLGAFLSGGIDSSSIVASMCKLRDPRANYTFSIGFEEPTYSELPEARSVASHYGVVHRDKVVLPDMAETLPEIAYYADEPFADNSIIPVYYLAQFAREHVTVCLSGDGGDELFAGYETYAADKLNFMMRWIPNSLVSIAEKIFSKAWPVSFGKVSFDYKLRKFLRGHSADLMKAHYTWKRIFSDAEQQRLLDPAIGSADAERSALQGFRKFEEHVADCHYLDRAMYVDIKTWLADDILVKVDRGTMAHSLEARAPYLDHRLVEFAASLPVEYKMKLFEGKHLLKRSLRGVVPDHILSGKKRGFNAPVSHWLLSSLGQFYERLLEPDGIARTYCRSGYVEQLWQNHCEKREDNSLKLFGLIALQLWHDRFGIRP